MATLTQGSIDVIGFACLGVLLPLGIILTGVGLSRLYVYLRGLFT